MKPELKLFFDFEFTSLSPDAQPISLGISTNINYTEDVLPVIDELVSDSAKGQQKNQDHYQNKIPKREVSFYAEFSDFYIERCDEWVKNNVVSRLILEKEKIPQGKVTAKHIDLVDGGDYFLYQKEWVKGDHETLLQFDNSPMIYGNTTGIKTALKNWLSQFSDHNIQFVKDAQSSNGTGLDWLKLVELIRIDNPLKDYAFIELTKGFKAIIDKSDLSEVSKHSWCAHVYKGKCYAETRISGKLLRLHQFLMGEKPFDNAVIDHENSNSLDYRRSNLRWCTQAQNNRNTSGRKSTSIYKGVRWHKSLNKFSAFIASEGKYIHLGMFVNERKAAEAYNKKAIELFREYARLNQFECLPKPPSNISPVPQDLNDLIAFKKGISAREAFDLNREELVGSWDNLEEIGQTGKVYNLDQFPKHNSLFDAKVIKAIYEKLSSKS